MRSFVACLCISFLLGGNPLLFSYGQDTTNESSNSSSSKYSKKSAEKQAKDTKQTKKGSNSSSKKGIDDGSDIIHFSPAVDCSHLAPREQAFAKKLTDANRYTFCREFTIEQRIEAMTMASEQITVKGPNGQRIKKNIATPDEAVQIINKNKP